MRTQVGACLLFRLIGLPFLGVKKTIKLRGTLLGPIRRNAVTTQAQEQLESSDFNHRLLAIGPTRNFSNF